MIKTHLTCVIILVALVGCETRSGKDFKEAKAAYVECLKAKGEAACGGEKNVMDATAGIYASASHKPVPAATMNTGTLGVYRAN